MTDVMHAYNMLSIYCIYLICCICVCIFSHVQLFSYPMNYSPPGFSVHGTVQTRLLEWVAIPSSGDLLNPGIKPTSPALAGRFFITEPPGKA